VLGVRGREYALDHNVKVVAFGKAVLGMLDALESLLGDHIIAGVASVPMGSSEKRYNDTFHNVNRDKSKVRVLEGAAGNLPDCQALSAASEILSLCREAREGEVVVALVSGGGSALLPCPIQGVTLQEKRTVIEALSKAGASIHELNLFRKFFSQTKGGKLAAAAYPAQMVALILSDVIGNPLDTIASGPTVPSNISRDDVITLLDKYSVTQLRPESIQSVLSTKDRQTQKPSPESSGEGVLIENGSYKHVQNAIVGSNSIATAAAADMATSMGYRPEVWSHLVQGEARLLGEAFAVFAHSHRNSERLSLLRKEPCFVELAQSNPAMVAEFERLDANLDIESPCNLCLISGGEPTVTVTGNGKGGRNQELALAFSLKYNQLSQQSDQAKLTPTQAAECVLFSLGTDGQDGPTDAAGAVGHASLIPSAAAQGIDAEGCLRRNDSYSFFSQVEGGKYHLKTGLTGTNVMDVHCILLTHTFPC
jgi:glycerate kinase